MEIETYQVRRRKGIVQTLIARESTTIAFVVAETPRQTEEWGSFAVEKKGGSSNDWKLPWGS